MKVLVVIHSMHSGGAERVTSNLSRSLIDHGWNVSVVTFASADRDFYVLHPAVKRISLDLAGDSSNIATAVLANVRRVQALRRTLKDEKPDIVLGMMTTSGTLAVLAASKLRCRVVVAERTYPPMIPLGRFWEFLRRWTYPRADHVVALTGEGKRWIEENCPGAQVTVIPNHVPWPLPCGGPYLEPGSIVGRNRFLLLAVGRLGEEKQFELLIRAFGSIAGHHSEWDLVILGEGKERVPLEKLVHDLGLEGRVKLPGLAGNVCDWYDRADLFVLSSRFEGFPNVLIEAMASGCPVISFDCNTGPRDIIQHEVNGLLVPAGDSVCLAEAMKTLMAEDDQRNQYAARAVEVRERFSEEKIFLLWEQLFSNGAFGRA